MADDATRPGDVGDEEYLDALPEDLDVSQFVGPTVFPDVGRRRIAGTIYLILAATCLAAETCCSL